MGFVDVHIIVGVSYTTVLISEVPIELPFRAACHLLCSALLSATNRVTPSDILSNIVFFLTHTSFEAERANSLQRHRTM